MSNFRLPFCFSIISSLLHFTPIVRILLHRILPAPPQARHGAVLASTMHMHSHVVENVAISASFFNVLTSYMKMNAADRNNASTEYSHP